MRFFGKRSVGEPSGGAEKREMDGAVKKIWESGCFDFEYYQIQSARYFKSVPEAIKHYILNGASQKLNPNRFFDTSWYLEHYSDVQARKTNPLLDYLSYAPKYDRNPSARFDNYWYISLYLGERSLTMSPLQHYISTGQYQDYIVSPFAFDLATAPLRPARFADLFQELVPQDGGVAFNAEFRVEPIPVERRVSVASITDEAEVPDETFPPRPYMAEFATVGIVGGTRLVIASNTTVLSDEIDAFRQTERWVPRPRDAHLGADGTLTLAIHRRYP